ncbi:MAG: electron transfer flavoprotein subunit alpha/FixB family protein, partial [Actinobacteria bacterium]|nr:electron transfer flavoprotein subunit alpha/FixB family protein [Actinomycetota bacterium]
MAEVLVLVDTVGDTADGSVKKVTLELLTAARQLGEPAAVERGRPDALDSLAHAALARV